MATLVEFGPYLPDMPVLGTNGSSIARNVIPLTDRSYGPLGNLAATTGSLTARCQGAVALRASDGTIHHFAGDATKLYKLSTTTWNDVSIAAGYTIGAEAYWYGVILGDRVMMTQLTDAIQSYVVGVSALFAVLAAAAPKAAKIAIIEPGFVMAGDTWDAADGFKPGRIWWCAQEDPTSWPTPGTAAAAAVQSDFQDLSIGGRVQQIIGAVGGASCAIFMESAVYRGDYTGDAAIFHFQDIERARGTPAPDSVINIGPFALYLGEDGFYAFDGAKSVPIGTKMIDRTFFDDADPDYFERMTSGADVTKKLAFWAYASNNAVNGALDKLLIYNWEINRWSFAEVTTEFIFRSFSQGLTLEQLGTLYGSIENVPLSLDSRAFAGGRITLAAFDTSHQMGSFEGSNLAATIETNEFNGNGKRFYINGLRAEVDGGTITAAIGYRETPQATVTYTTATSAGGDGICPQNISARFARVRVSIAAGGDWDHAIGVEPELIEDGER